jgi:hypothetical protein
MSRPSLPLALLFALPLLHACGGSLEEDGRVRLVNATNNYAGIDVVVDDETIISATGIGAASGYAKVEAGDLSFELRSSGSSSTVASTTASVAADEHRTLLAYVTDGSLQVVSIGEDEDSPDAGKARLKVLNAASGEVASVDVYLVDKACSALDDTDMPAFSDLTGVDDASFSQITAAAAGTSYQLCVTTSDDPADLRLALPAFTLSSQQVVTLALTRSRGGALLNAVRIDQQGEVSALDNPSARVRLVADGASAAAVSASANGVVLSTGTASPSVGAYRLVDAGTLSPTVAIGGTAVSSGSFAAAAGADLTLLVAGTASEPTLRLLEDANLPSTSSSKPVKIRLVNGLNGASGTLLMTVDGDVVADGIAFGAASGATNVAASNATATLEVSLGGTVLKSLADVTLSSSRVYTYFVLGDASGTLTGVLRADR